MMFSVIIPTINEEQNLHDCVTSLRGMSDDMEIVVADGGSTDRTVEMALDAGATICRSPRGRGVQMNAGAAVASGDILVFLHADTRLSEGAFTVLRECFRDPEVQVGTFRVKYDASHPLLDLYTQLAIRHDSMFSTFGDQCMVARRPFFFSLGGFPEWPLFEDVHFLRSARRVTHIRRFPATAVTSARRLQENGIARQMLRDVWYIIQYWWGVSPEELARKYG